MKANRGVHFVTGNQIKNKGQGLTLGARKGRLDAASTGSGQAHAILTARWSRRGNRKRVEPSRPTSQAARPSSIRHQDKKQSDSNAAWNDRRTSSEPAQRKGLRFKDSWPAEEVVTTRYGGVWKSEYQTIRGVGWAWAAESEVGCDRCGSVLVVLERMGAEPRGQLAVACQQCREIWPEELYDDPTRAAIREVL
jgi:hypothetical protein